MFIRRRESSVTGDEEPVVATYGAVYSHPFLAQPGRHCAVVEAGRYLHLQLHVPAHALDDAQYLVMRVPRVFREREAVDQARLSALGLERRLQHERVLQVTPRGAADATLWRYGAEAALLPVEQPPEATPGVQAL